MYDTQDQGENVLYDKLGWLVSNKRIECASCGTFFSTKDISDVRIVTSQNVAGCRRAAGVLLAIIGFIVAAMCLFDINAYGSNSYSSVNVSNFYPPLIIGAILFVIGLALFGNSKSKPLYKVILGRQPYFYQGPIYNQNSDALEFVEAVKKVILHY